MHTIIDKIIAEKGTLAIMQKAATMVEILRTGLFGVYHYKLQDVEFEQINICRGKYNHHYWVMRKNGKQYTVKYCYVVYITLKRLGLLS